jgi:uridine kinase
MIRKPIIIGVCGGTSCGKTSVATKIKKRIEERFARFDNRVRDLNIIILSQDNSYKTLTPEEIEKAYNSEYNFDHPNAQDNDLFFGWLSKIQNGFRVNIPVYDFVTHSHSGATPDIIVEECDVLIVEGMLLFYHSEIRELLDFKIFVDVADDERLARRIERDIKHRGRETESVLSEWRKFAQPGFKQFIFPTKEYADIIVPRGGRNVPAIEMITTHLIEMLISQ